MGQFFPLLENKKEQSVSLGKKKEIDIVESGLEPTHSSNVNGNMKKEDVNNTTRQRLIDFYKIYNPQKLNDDEAIEKVLRRYNGRETKLFNDLNRKYNVPSNTNKKSKQLDVRNTDKIQTFNPNDTTVLENEIIRNEKQYQILINDTSLLEAEIIRNE
eukprot:531359_1